MSNPRKKKHLPPPPLSDILGKLSDEPYDSGLKVDQASAPAPIEPPPAPESAPADTLRLPRGALVALRRSGGFKFRSREVVVYRDGRVHYDDGESGPRTVWTLSDAELAELRRALNQAGFAKLPAAGRQNPDAFVYEIVARPARRVYSVETFQGSIPASLAPLIQQLNRFAGMDGPS
jgi:emfourin